MIGYETQEQQEQAIKDFLKKNGLALVLGALVGFGGLFAWEKYSEHQLTVKEDASTAYNDGIEFLVNNESVDGLQSFVSENPQSGYAPLAGFIMAQKAVENEDYTAAVDALRSAINEDAALSNIARIRLAALYIQLSDYSQALNVLEQVQAVEFAGQANELKGDAYAAQGLYEEARLAYQQSLDQTSSAIVRNKINNIPFLKSKTENSESE